MRKIQETLANQRDYKGAQRIKDKGDEMQRWELENLKKEWRKKIQQKQEKFIAKQAAELEAFKKRIEAGREKQKRIRQDKLNRILQRYQNIKAGLTRQQNVEAVKEAKQAETALCIHHISTIDRGAAGYQHPRTNISKPQNEFTPKRAFRKVGTHVLGTAKSKRDDQFGFNRRTGNDMANTRSGSLRYRRHAGHAEMRACICIGGHISYTFSC